MGRITWESIGRALPDRVNIVLSRSKSFQDQRCLVLSSLEEALNFAEHNGETEAFIIGGENIYNLAMPFAQRIYLTLVHASLPVDTYFPDINWDEWSIQSSQKFPASPSDQFSSTFTILIRKKFNPASN